MRKRVLAHKLRHGIEGDLPIVWQFMDSKLTDPKTAAYLKQRAAAVDAEFRSKHGVRLGLIVVDTAIAACRPENENDAAQMTAIIMWLKQLARETRTSIVPIMHLNKSSPEISGSYASVAYSDVILAAAAEIDATKGVHKNRRLVMTKNRFGPTGEFGGFDLKLVRTGTDKKGRACGSCAVSESHVNAPFDFASAWAAQAVAASIASLTAANVLPARDCPAIVTHAPAAGTVPETMKSISSTAASAPSKDRPAKPASAARCSSLISIPKTSAEAVHSVADHIVVNTMAKTVMT